MADTESLAEPTQHRSFVEDPVPFPVMRVNAVPSARGSRTAHTDFQDSTDPHSNGVGNGWTNGDIHAAKKDDNKKENNSDDTGEKHTPLRKPFIFVRWVTNRPRLAFGIALGTHLTFLALSGILFLSGYDLFPANFETVPMELHDEPWLKRDLAWRGRDSYSNRVVRSLPSSKTTSWCRGQTAEGLLLFYDAGSGNVFTEACLQKMQQIEDALTNVSNFTDYCQLVTASGPCVKPLSVLRFFDGTYEYVDSVFNDTSFSNIGPVLYAANTYNETKSAFVYALGKSHSITSTSVTATLTRTLIPLGSPLSGYTDENSVVTALTEFMADHMQPTLDSFLDLGIFEFTYYNTNLMYYNVKQQAYYDMALALGSLIFIFIFILFHTRSLWITCMAELSIISSFVETTLIYRIVLDFRYFGYFHVLALFIILGIGADDLFVFWDAWTATGLQKHPSLAHRLNEAYRKSVISMMVTSLTTMTAFVANALSPLLITRSFGIFAAVLVGINYLFVITFFPTIVIFYHLHFEDKPHPCCCCWGNDKDDEVDDSTSGATLNNHSPDLATVPKYTSIHSEPTQNGHLTPIHDLQLVRQDTNNQLIRQDSKTQLFGLGTGQDTKTQLNRGDTDSNRVHPGNASTQPAVASFGLKSSYVNTISTPPNVKKTTSCKDRIVSCCGQSSGKRSRLVVFFSEYYFRFVTHKVARWVIVAALLGCLVGFAISASYLEPNKKQIQLFKDSHHYTKAITHKNFGFVANDLDRTITIHLVWGLGEQDLSSCHFSEVDCKGKQVFDDNFQPSTQAAQQAFVDICDALFNLSASDASRYKIKRNLLTGELEVACFPRNMKTFLQSDAVSGSVDVSMPWNWTETQDFMTYLNSYYNTSAFNSSFTEYLDIPLTYWIWDAFQQSNTEDWQKFNTLIGEQTDTFSNYILTSSSVQVGNKVKYLAIAVNTTLKLQSLGYQDGIPVVELWEQFMKTQLSNMPTEMQSGFQTTIVSWHWLYVQKSLADNAVLGIVVGVCLAFPVLVLSTCNILNGFLATLTICCITVCVIGVIPLGGWKLDVLVSLNMCLVVGLAVDFVVHLADGYYMSNLSDRHSRLKEALERMGISVFSGACTTLGASAFMLFAQIRFFFQFGIFMFCTIGFSLVFSMGLYVTIMGIMGPEGDVGDIRVLARKCCARIRPKKSAVDHAVSSDSDTTVVNGTPPQTNVAKAAL